MSDQLNFDKLCELYQTDPEQFEEFRRQEIEKVINSAPESSQKRLRGIQFQVDAKRQINKNAPFVACMEISKMMHESFDELRHNLNLVAGNKTPVYYPQECELSADNESDPPPKVVNLFR